MTVGTRDGGCLEQRRAGPLSVGLLWTIENVVSSFFLEAHGLVAVGYALPALVAAGYLLIEVRVPVHVGERRDSLLAVKHGELSWEKVAAWRRELHRDFEQALAKAKLPERPDYEAANALLVQARRQVV